MKERNFLNYICRNSLILNASNPVGAESIAKSRPDEIRTKTRKKTFHGLISIFREKYKNAILIRANKERSGIFGECFMLDMFDFTWFR